MTSTHSYSAFSTQATTNDGGENWLQLLPAGTFAARRTGRGPFNAGGQSELMTIVAATLELAGSTELFVDYDHQQVFGAVPGIGGRAPAAGWIKQLKVKDDGIWGRVEWTAAASAAIKAGEYRYLSPVFKHKSNGDVIAISMAGLTNLPDLDLAQVVASGILNLTQQETDMDKIIAALGLKKDSDENAVLSAITSMLASSTAIITATGLGKDAKPDDVIKAVTEAFSSQLAIAKAVGVAVDANGEVILTAVNSAVSGASGDDPDPLKYVPKAAFDELSNQVATMSASIVGDKATDVVEAAMSAGKVSPALKDWALRLAKKDMAGFETFIASAPVIVAPQILNSKKDAAMDTSTDASDQAVMSALGIDEKDFKEARALES